MKLREGNDSREALACITYNANEVREKRSTGQKTYRVTLIATLLHLGQSCAVVLCSTRQRHNLTTHCRGHMHVQRCSTVGHQ
jgi:hypothetical protein